jgi:hypothetical protein
MRSLAILYFFLQFFDEVVKKYFNMSITNKIFISHHQPFDTIDQEKTVKQDER